MATCKVWNDNVHPHTEKFKGDIITIPPKSFIEMNEDDAVMFRGQWTPMKKDGGGQVLPTSYKMIRIESSGGPVTAKSEDKSKHNCIACKYEATSAADLQEHLNLSHSENLISNKDPEQMLRSKKVG